MSVSEKTHEEIISESRDRCVILPIVVKRKWFDMIASGEKKEEYREKKLYWDRMINGWHRRMWARGAGFAVVEFRDNYGRDARRIAFFAMNQNRMDRQHYSIRIKKKHPEWGEWDGERYVIHLGQQVKLTDSKEEETK